MKHLITVLLTICCCYFSKLTAQIAINQDNSNPDASAILDVKSTDKGFLVPRMTTAQRTTVSNPATGLMVFDNTTNSFWFYAGSTWVEFQSGAVVSLQDSDNDTKIQVEKNPDEDFIRFDIAGTEIAQWNKNTSGDMLLQTTTSNVFIGLNTGAANTGTGNISIGNNAASAITSGTDNVVLGDAAGSNLLTGNRNVVIGKDAGLGLTDNYSNTFIGASAGGSFVGNGNVFVGQWAGSSTGSGNNNVAVGQAAGLGSSGGGNVFIGNFAGAFAMNNNKLYINNVGGSNPLIYGDFDTNELTVNGTLIGAGPITPNSGIKFPFADVADFTYVGSAGNFLAFGHSSTSEDFIGYKSNAFYFRDSPNGEDTENPDVYAKSFMPYSSRRWKHNIQDLEDALSIIHQLQGVTYTWNEDQGGKDDFGFIAEEVHEVLPQIAPKDEAGNVNGLDYGKITPLLVEAVKEQQVQIQNLQNENSKLSSQLQTVLQRLEALENEK